MSAEIKKLSINRTIYAKVLSPLHIGGASEKHAQRGLDYIQQGNQIFMIDQTKLLTELLKRGKLDEFSYEIAENANNVQNLLTRYRILINTIAVDGKPSKASQASDGLLRTFVKNGMGKEFIPGSSMKGSVRSALFNHFNEGQKPKGSIRDIEKSLFGEITNNLMRYIQLADSTIGKQDIQVLTTKVMSRDNSSNITWKDRNRGSKRDFDDSSFTTNYECIRPDAIFEFRLTLSDGLAQFVKQAKTLPPNSNKIFVESPDVNLLKLIDSHTREHIKKEIVFFKFKETDLSKKIATFLESLLVEIPNTYLMRMAGGSGFHGISGDWQFEDHTDSLKNPDGDNRKKRYKTRRLAIVDNDLLPMGFLRLHLEKPTIQNTIIIEPPKPEEKPEYYAGVIKQGAEVFAQLTESQGSKKKFKLLLEKEGKEQIVMLNYAADLSINSFHKVQIASVQKGKNGVMVQSIQYKRPI